MLLLLLFLSFFFFFSPSPPPFSPFPRPLFRLAGVAVVLLASPWLEVAQTEVVWAAERGPPAPQGSPRGAFPPSPSAALRSPPRDGQGRRSWSDGGGGFWGVGGRGAWRTKGRLNPVDGGQLPSCLLQAPLGATVLSWRSLPGDWVFLKWLVCFC